MIYPVLHWLHTTFLGHLMVQFSQLFPICQVLHFLGLCLLMGGLFVVDLRLVGVLKTMSMETAFKFLPPAILGFVINLITGILFIASDPDRYWTNWMFKLKMTLILLAGINALWFTLVEQPKVLSLPAGADTDRATKIAAVLSLLIWCLVLISGRYLPVTQVTGA